jgi:hypothetical protein
MKVVKTDVVSSLAVFFDRDAWKQLDIHPVPDNAECRVEVDYPGGATLYITVGALREARRAYSTLKRIWKDERDLREMVRNEVYTILGEFSQTLKGEGND